MSPSRADMLVHVHVYTHIISASSSFELVHLALYGQHHTSVAVGVGVWLTVLDLYIHVHRVYG